MEYKSSFYALKKVTKEFNRFPTVKEWNYYAKQHQLLNSETIKYLTGLDWHKLRGKVITEIKNETIV